MVANHRDPVTTFHVPGGKPRDCRKRSAASRPLVIVAAARNRYAWSEDEGHEFTPGKLRRLTDVAARAGAEVRRDVLRMLVLDGLVPMTADVQVRDGIVTLNGSVASEREREDVSYLAGLVPGVFGIVDQLASRSLSRADATSSEAAA
jgi:hypothetical protein